MANLAVQKWVECFAASLECSSRILKSYIYVRRADGWRDEKDSWYTFHYHHAGFREFLKVAGQDLEGLRANLQASPILQGNQAFLDTFERMDREFKTVEEQTCELGKYIGDKCRRLGGVPEPPVATAGAAGAAGAAEAAEATGEVLTPIEELVIVRWEKNVTFNSTRPFLGEVVRQIRHLKNDAELSGAINECFYTNLADGLPFKYMGFVLAACERCLESFPDCMSNLVQKMIDEEDRFSPTDVDLVDQELTNCQKAIDQARMKYRLIDRDMRLMGKQDRFNRRLLLS